MSTSLSWQMLHLENSIANIVNLFIITNRWQCKISDRFVLNDWLICWEKFRSEFHFLNFLKRSSTCILNDFYADSRPQNNCHTHQITFDSALSIYDFVFSSCHSKLKIFVVTFQRKRLLTRLIVIVELSLYKW